MRKQKESSRDSKYFPLGFKENLSENAGEKTVRSRDSHLSRVKEMVPDLYWLRPENQSLYHQESWKTI